MSKAQTWHPLPGGSSPDGPSGILYHDSTYLWIAGVFTHAGGLTVQNVVRHNGTNYIATPGFDGFCNKFIKFQRKIYACGRFTVSGLTYGLLRFDDTYWTPLMQIPNAWGRVLSAVLYDGKLYIAGDFTNIGSLTNTRMAYFNGTTWTTFMGLNDISGTNTEIWSLFVDGNNLYIGGGFTGSGYTLSPTSATDKCLVFDGTTWSARPVNASSSEKVYGFLKYQNAIYAYGYTHGYISNPYGSGTHPEIGCNGIMFGPATGWTTWSCVGSGLEIVVKTSIEFNGSLYAAGSEMSFHPFTINRLQKWDGTSWTPDPYFDPAINNAAINSFEKSPTGQVLYVGGQFSFNNGTEQIDNIGYTTTGTPLPIKLVSFSGKCKNEETALSWQTASETNNVRFDVEYTQDDKQFKKIGSVLGHGTTLIPHSYEWFHDAQAGGYYRLKQIDFDSTATYSKIIFVAQCDNSNYSLYPTIASDYITISGLHQNQKYTIRIYDEYMRPRSFMKSAFMKDAEIIDVSDFMPGIYIVIFGEGDKNRSVRFVKQ